MCVGLYTRKITAHAETEQIKYKKVILHTIVAISGERFLRNKRLTYYLLN